MPVKRDRNAVDRYCGITFDDDARGMPVDRTNASIPLSRHGNAVDEYGRGSSNHFAAVASCVTESNHILHGLLSIAMS